MTLADFVRDVKNAIAPPKQPPPYQPFQYTRPVPVVQVPMLVPAHPTDAPASLVSSHGIRRVEERSGLVGGR